MGSISKTARHVGNLVFYLRSKIRSLGSWWKNHTVPQQPGTSSSSCSPACSTLLWHCIPVCHSQVSRCGCVGKCSLCSVTELIPPGSRWLWVLPGLSALWCHITEVVRENPGSVVANTDNLEDEGRSQIVELQHRCWLHRQW